MSTSSIALIPSIKETDRSMIKCTSPVRFSFFFEWITQGMDEMRLEPLHIVVVPVEWIHALARRTVVVRLRNQPLDGGALPRLLHLALLPLTHLSTQIFNT
jgi:hypothetical protein